ncbi:TIGR02270 family protein [Myxococcus xanthus]|uniref:TIGR02270 family protein n=1 Tax=Myxococcus xanthus TaxID=34 RepID=UPI0019176350|nr:TIGR02270 family protein [Myxococcus xanthus]QQR45132.1 TIGR02270 family protein [Myxococcus xanthus]
MRWDILEDHLNEASFLWTQWERALVAPHYSLREVAGLEERLLAHLDGLVLGGPEVTRRLLEPALGSGESGSVEAAAFCLLAEENDPEVVAPSAWIPAEAEVVSPGVLRVLEVCERPALSAQLTALVLQRPFSVQVQLVDVLATRRSLPENVLEPLFESGVAEAQVAVLRVVASVPVPPGSRWVQRALDSPNPMVRYAALEAGLILGSHEAWSLTQVLACTPTPDAGRARLLSAMGGAPDIEVWLGEALHRSALRKDALEAAACCGLRALADACLPLMRDDAWAALAGEAFCAITGLVLEKEFVAPRRPEESALPLLEEDLATDLELRPESALPVPEPAAVERWWSRARARFEPGVRYVRGRPFSLERLMDELEAGPMRRRDSWALELAIRSRGEHWPRVRAFTGAQVRALMRARGNLPSSRAMSFRSLLGRTARPN